MNRSSRLVAGAAAASAALVSLSAASQAQIQDPNVALDRTGTAAGDELVVTGGGWVPGSTVIIELCGHGGISGSVDCDVGHQRTARVSEAGTFVSALTVALPPAPCPCVVKVADESSHIAATAAIAVQGIPTVPITEADQGPVRAVTIATAEVRGGSWTEWFGAASPRTLHLELVNTGDVEVHDVPLTVAWGRGGDPHGFVETPVVESMEPGETRSLDLRLPRGAFAFGSYTATAEVQGFAEPIVARDSESTYPWGWLALALVLVQILLVRARNRLRRRIAVEEIAAAEMEPEPMLAVAEVAAASVLALPAVADPEPNGSAEPEPPGEPVPVPTAAIALVALPAVGALDGRPDDDAIDLRDVSLPDAAVKAELVALQRDVRASLRQSAEFTDGLVVAALARADEARRRATEHDRLARTWAAEATEVVREAHAQAMTVLAAAEVAAAELRRAAEVEEEAARLALASATADQEAALESARSAIERVLADLEPRIDALTARLEPAVLELVGDDAAQLSPASGRDEPPDELDRMVASAIARALSSS